MFLKVKMTFAIQINGNSYKLGHEVKPAQILIVLFQFCKATLI